MNTKLTYIEARDKIWNAYFRDEIKPFEEKFCFCGTLANNETDWNRGCPSSLPYSYNQYKTMELPLLDAVCIGTLGSNWKSFWVFKGGVPLHKVSASENYEDAVFAGMLAALEVLKQIHRDRGDYIPEDETPLTKRRDPRTLAVYDGGAGILS